ncbi:MAG: transketolase family protein [Clostridiales bacterium]|nr:transketolase family protein [Clostridiales bacterium]
MGSEIATRVAYGDALCHLGEANPKVVVLDADLSAATQTNKFAKAFPDRFFDCGIAEGNMMSVSSGLALSGLIPFASTFAMFGAGRAYEQVRNSIAYPRANVKVAVTHSGISVGEDGASHQCIEDIALMRAMPNMTVVCPSDAVEAYNIILAAAEVDAPWYIRLGRSAVPVIHSSDYQFKLGKGEVLKSSSNDDVTIIATGLMVDKALKAYDILQKQGITARVVNMATIKPIDSELILKCARETKAIVTAEEHNIIGGLGSAVSEVMATSGVAKLGMIGMPDCFGRSGSPAELFKLYKMTENDIADKAIDVLK